MKCLLKCNNLANSADIYVEGLRLALKIKYIYSRLTKYAASSENKAKWGIICTIEYPAEMQGRIKVK